MGQFVCYFDKNHAVICQGMESFCGVNSEGDGLLFDIGNFKAE